MKFVTALVVLAIIVFVVLCVFTIQAANKLQGTLDKRHQVMLQAGIIDIWKGTDGPLMEMTATQYLRHLNYIDQVQAA